MTARVLSSVCGASGLAGKLVASAPMTNASWPLRGSMVLALFLGGCAAQTAPDEPAANADVASGADGPLGQSASALVAFDPCASDWQLPTSARRYLDEPNGAFIAFENRLEAGGARWIGSFSLPKPHRAIVRVDHYLAGTKKDPRSGLWFLAAIPVSSRDALAAIRDFSDVSPVKSRELGYCLSDGRFMRNSGSGPGNAAVKQVIVEYDPRCVCADSVFSIQTWVSYPSYAAVPVP
jgi:hypothetical protein